MFPCLELPKGIRNPFQYYPESFLQDKDESIICLNGMYDITRFSVHERDVIKDVLYTVKRKYPKKFASMGLINESYPIVYKPRYILFEIAIILYGESLNPIDLFSVSFANATKGAIFRKEAISYFEKSFEKISYRTFDKFASQNFCFVCIKFSELY